MWLGSDGLLKLKAPWEWQSHMWHTNEQ